LPKALKDAQNNFRLQVNLTNEECSDMAGIADITIVNSNNSPSVPVESGTVKTLCSPDLCGSENLTVYRRTIAAGRRFEVQSVSTYNLAYVIHASGKGSLVFAGNTYPIEDGAGVLLAPGETARFEASEGPIDLLHIVVPKPPAAVEADLPGGPGYFFNRKTLRALSDASGGRVRRFCAESSVRLRDGRRLTSTNAIQAGEMHYNEGGASPYHVHRGTPANPAGAAHCYMTFQGRGVVEVENEFSEIEPGTLVYFPPGVPHRLRSHGGPLDYFEIQAWRSFKTTILSEEPLGLKWFYERENPNQELVEWNQS
jgi:mannose-6-phosphate isomerase-like protein (cupin superfamily)